MIDEESIRSIIREMIKDVLSEISTSDGAGAYLTPMAFSGKSQSNKARRVNIATQLGYMLTDRGKRDEERPADRLHEARMRYHEYKNDETASPTQKIAKAISEVNRNLEEMERIVRMNTRLQKESGLASEALYRRTQQGLLKLEARLLHLAGKVREIRGK